MTEIERVKAELARERATVHACPNGCGTLVPVGIDAAVKSHMEARQKAEARFIRLAEAVDRFLNRFLTDFDFEATELRGAMTEIDIPWQ